MKKAKLLALAALPLLLCGCEAEKTITEINSVINDFVWVKSGLFILLGTGILMTVLTKVFQISHIGLWFKHTLGSLFQRNVIGHTKDKSSISQFQALCTALAATIGVGNIAGVAAAIVVGGPGAVFWMWLAAFFGMMTNYSENVLGIFYRRKNAKGEWAGGAMYYLQDGLGAKKHCKKLGRILAILFSCFTVLAAFGIGNVGQVNKIVANIESAFPIESLSSVPVGGVSLYAILIGVALLHAVEAVLRGIPPGKELYVFRTALHEIFGEHTEEDHHRQNGHQSIDNRGEKRTSGEDHQKVSQKPDGEVQDQKSGVQLIAAVSTVHEAQDGVLHFIEKITHGRPLDSNMISFPIVEGNCEQVKSVGKFFEKKEKSKEVFLYIVYSV